MEKIEMEKTEMTLFRMRWFTIGFISGLVVAFIINYHLVRHYFG